MTHQLKLHISTLIRFFSQNFNKARFHWHKISTPPPIIIDLTITFDAPESLNAGYARKIEKYSCLGLTLPFVIGALGSWLPSNNTVATSLGIRPTPWRRLRRKCRLMAIQGSVAIINRHIRGNQVEDDATAPAP